MRGDVFVKDGDELDRHQFVWHVSGHAHEQAFRCNGLIARRYIELTSAQSFEAFFQRGKEFVGAEQFFDFFVSEEQHGFSVRKCVAPLLPDIPNLESVWKWIAGINDKLINGSNPRRAADGGDNGFVGPDLCFFDEAACE